MAKKKNKSANHPLSELVGKKIKSITLQEVNVDGDGENIRQFYRIICSGAEPIELILACDGGNTQQYATASIMEPSEFKDFLEEVELDLDLDAEEDESDDEEDESDEDLTPRKRGSSSEDEDDDEDEDSENDYVHDLAGSLDDFEDSGYRN